MIENRIDVTVSLPRLAAWAAWAAVAALLVAYVLTDDMRPAVVGLATSAAAATLHIRCFCMRLSRNIRVAVEVFERGHGEGSWPGHVRRAPEKRSGPKRISSVD